MIRVSHSYRVRDTRIAPFCTSYRSLPHLITLAPLVRYDVGRVRYDVRKGAIRESRTRYECDTRIMPWYPINIIPALTCSCSFHLWHNNSEDWLAKNMLKYIGLIANIFSKTEFGLRYKNFRKEVAYYSFFEESIF